MSDKVLYDKDGVLVTMTRAVFFPAGETYDLSKIMSVALVPKQTNTTMAAIIVAI